MKRIYTDDSVMTVSRAVSTLKGVRRELRTVGASKAADYIARALKSVAGAERHARRMSNGLHRHRRWGVCSVCDHYGDDCTGTL